MFTEDSNEYEFQKAVNRIHSGTLEAMQESRDNKNLQIFESNANLIPVSQSIKISPHDFEAEDIQTKLIRNLLTMSLSELNDNSRIENYSFIKEDESAISRS